MIPTKPPRCKHCKTRTDRVGKVLHDDCMNAWIAGQLAKQQRERVAKQRAKAKVERVQIKARKAALKRIPDLIAEADKEFAAYIRARDRLAGFPCISSGKPLDWVSGNQVDAGHYRSRGAASALRYHEDNCHAQSKYENRHRAGNAVEYRIRLIERIGLERVEALEAMNTPHKWQRDELIAIRATYIAKRKELEAQRA